MTDKMTVEQAAPLVHLKAATLRRKVSNGEIEATRVGKRWLLTEEALNDFLKKCPQSR